MRRASLPELLSRLTELLGDACEETTAAMQHASTALLDDRERLAQRVLSRAGVLDDLRREIEAVAMETVVAYAPMAGDMRAVVSGLRSTDDLERMGALARHVARVAVRRPGDAVPGQARPVLEQMATLAVDLAMRATEVLRTRNVVLAVELAEADDAMDDLHEGMFGVLMSPGWPHGVAVAVDVTLLARYYERYADHAVALARRVGYAVTGERTVTLPGLGS